MEREKFEREFADAFKGAEQSPSENVWVNIELELERAESKKMKKRVFFYQMLAAASITFALILTGAGILFLRDNDGHTAGMLATNVPATVERETGETRTSVRPQTQTDVDKSKKLQQIEESNAGQEPSATHSERPILTEEGAVSDGRAMAGLDIRGSDGVGGRDIRKDPTLVRETSRQNNDNNENRDGAPAERFANTTELPVAKNDALSTKLPSHESESDGADLYLRDTSMQTGGLLALDDSLDGEGGSLDTGYSEHGVNAATDRASKPNTNENSSEPDPGQLLLAKLSDLEKELAEQGAGGKKESEGSKEKVWTSVGFAAGGYNGQASTPAQASSLVALNSAVENQAEASGVAYSVNISMGTRITNRLVLQGGLSYLNNNTTYISNQVVRAENMDFKAATMSDLRAAGSSLFNNNTVIPTAPHSVSNNIEFISIPVQAGYIVIDRKFGLQFNAGVATDFFIQNTIDTKASGVKPATQDRGSDSPYRSTNFSGLMGTEFTYRLGDKYRIAVNPGLRYPLNSIYKEETGIESTPLTFDVGLRFRYIFR